MEIQSDDLEEILKNTKLLLSLDKSLSATTNSYTIDAGSATFNEVFSWKIVSKDKDGKETSSVNVQSETFRFTTIDKIAPKVNFITVPDHKPKRLKIDDSLIVVFSEMIDPSSINVNHNINLINTITNDIIAITNTLHAKNRVLKITPDNNLTRYTPYKLTIKDLEDRHSNKMVSPLNKSFISSPTPATGDFGDVDYSELERNSSGGVITKYEDKFIAKKKQKYKYD